MPFQNCLLGGVLLLFFLVLTDVFGKPVPQADRGDVAKAQGGVHVVGGLVVELAGDLFFLIADH